MGLKLHENPKQQEPCQTPKSEYEQSREDRIRQNLEKMKKLGIVELSLGLKCNNISPLQPRRQAKNINNNNKTPPSVSPLQRSSEPSRRSSRLKNTLPAMYSEVELSKKKKAPLFDDEDFAGENSRPEIYNEEHFKLLGSTEKSWTLFVDGYGSNGKRIYDPVNGKTCHQCRQKTLGYRTHCIECNKVQGQFCGDCLYIRYGEHVLEAHENPDWVCPVCRGICNCSLCRQAKGWAPTGPLYKKITRLGFKSVAHYLIQTRCSEANNDTTANEVSAKRSLTFSEQLEEKSDDDKDSSKQPLGILALTPPGIESSENVTKSCSQVVSEISLDKEMVQESFTPQLNSDSVSGKNMEHGDDEDEKRKEAVSFTPPKTNKQKKLVLVRVLSPDSIGGRLRRNISSAELVESPEEVQPPDFEVLGDNKIAGSIGGKLRQRHKTSDIVESEKQKEDFISDGDCSLKAATPKQKQKLALVTVPSGGSIGGRLRQRRMDSTPVKVVSSETSESIQTPLKETLKLSLNRALVVVPSSESIGGRLRQRCMDSAPAQVVSSESSESIRTPSKETPKLSLKCALVVVPSSESIGGRLRQRRMDSAPAQVVSSESSESIRTPSKETPKLNKKRALVVVPSSDSISGRLRLRRKMSDVEVL